MKGYETVTLDLAINRPCQTCALVMGQGYLAQEESCPELGASICHLCVRDYQRYGIRAFTGTSVYKTYQLMRRGS